MVGGLELNEDTVELFVDGEKVKLTPMEFKILLLLMKHPGRVFYPASPDFWLALGLLALLLAGTAWLGRRLFPAGEDNKKGERKA